MEQQEAHRHPAITTVDYPSELATVLPQRDGKVVSVVLALGVFDGVHRGHQAIFRELVSLGKDLDAEPIALFFEPHPRGVLGKGNCPLRLTDIGQKTRLLSELGIKYCVCFPFTLELAGLSPETFYNRYLACAGVSIRGYCVGEDWRFGSRNAGDGTLLRSLSATEVRIVPPVLDEGRPVSSTRIREALSSGQVEEASRLLGRTFSLSGSVSHGQGKGGSVLSYPTANVKGTGVQLPKFGVYAARGVVGGERHDGIVYVGDAPTLRGRDIIVELHLFDYSGDMYGKELTVEFVSYLRESCHFADAAALRRQIGLDIERAKSLLALAAEH